MAHRRGNGVKAHKFSIGQSVYLSGLLARSAAGGSYRIVKLLPPEAGDYQYRIKNVAEAYERVAKESQLERDR